MEKEFKIKVIDGHGDIVCIGDLVEVPYPNKTDKWEGEMLSTIIEIIDDNLVIIIDDDGNQYKIETTRLNNL